MPKPEIGLWFWPWDRVPDLVDFATEAMNSYLFDELWICDNLQYEDPFVIMAAWAAKLRTSVGTSVTFPYARNPIVLASLFSSISELVGDENEVGVGIGAAGAVQLQVIKTTKPISTVREAVIFLRKLFDGQTVGLKDFPRLCEEYRLNEEGQAQLKIPPSRRIPIYVATSSGLKMASLAGELSDGIIVTSLSTYASMEGIRQGLLQSITREAQEARSRAGISSILKKLYFASFSVSHDTAKAKDKVKRNISYALAGHLRRYPDRISVLGLSKEKVGLIREVYDKGLGPEVAATMVADELIDKSTFAVAGSPAECREKGAALFKMVTDLGFHHFAFGVPLGPDVKEAVKIIAKEIIPSL